MQFPRHDLTHSFFPPRSATKHHRCPRFCNRHSTTREPRRGGRNARPCIQAPRFLCIPQSCRRLLLSGVLTVFHLRLAGRKEHRDRMGHEGMQGGQARNWASKHDFDARMPDGWVFFSFCSLLFLLLFSFFFSCTPFPPIYPMLGRTRK